MERIGRHIDTLTSRIGLTDALVCSKPVLQLHYTIEVVCI